MHTVSTSKLLSVPVILRRTSGRVRAKTNLDAVAVVLVGLGSPPLALPLGGVVAREVEALPLLLGRHVLPGKVERLVADGGGVARGGVPHQGAGGLGAGGCVEALRGRTVVSFAVYTPSSRVPRVPISRSADGDFPLLFVWETTVASPISCSA